MRQVLGWLAVLLLAAGCVMYSRGERYFCFSPEVEKCKQPPYHYPPVTYPEHRPLEAY